jgi:DNA adenine methylase
VPQEGGPRIASDINWRMVALLDAVGNKGWLPPETMTKTEWSKITKNPEKYPPELVAFAATGPTFGSKWMDTWAKDDPGKEGTRYRQARDALINDAKGLTGTIFYQKAYDQLTEKVPVASLIYCDPPYRDTAMYSGAKVKIEVGSAVSNEWKPGKFWKWADAMVDAGHSVFVSEYQGPHPEIYSGETPELKQRRDAYYAEAKALDRRIHDDPASFNFRESENLRAKLKDIDAGYSAERRRMADRWKVVWEKEVVSDFSSTRGKTETAKEIEARVKEAQEEFYKAIGEFPDDKEKESEAIAVLKAAQADLKNAQTPKVEVEKLFHREP